MVDSAREFFFGINKRVARLAPALLTAAFGQMVADIGVPTADLKFLCQAKKKRFTEVKRLQATPLI